MIIFKVKRKLFYKKWKKSLNKDPKDKAYVELKKNKVGDIVQEKEVQVPFG